jgi:hypothetical protein
LVWILPQRRFSVAFPTSKVFTIMSNSPSSSSSSTSSTASPPSERESIWVTLGGLALGVGGFLAFKGLQHMYNTQQKKEQKWIEGWSTPTKKPMSEKAACIYLDYNGTTPVYEDVVRAMWPYLTEHFGNPSSGHAYGKVPRQAIDYARAQILRSLLQSPAPLDAIWFTGCGTESDNLAIQLAIQSSGHITTKKHIVTCNVEHPAIERYLK